MTEPRAADGAATDNPLSEREKEVAEQLITGASNAEIARTLIISPHTVKVHLRNIFEKLRVNSRIEASMVLLQRGWVTVPGVILPENEQRPFIPDPAPLADRPARPFPWQRVYMLAAFLIAILALWAPAVISRPQTPPDLLTDAGHAIIGAPVIETPPRWEARTPLGASRDRLAAAVSDGQVYVLGGEGEGGRALDLATAYDLQFNEWRTLPPLPGPAANLAAAALDGRIYVAGGSVTDEKGNSEIRDDFWVFDPESEEWTSLTALPQPLAGAELAADEEALYLLGGWDGQQMRNEVWRYQPASDRNEAAAWTLVTRLDVPRAFFGAAMVNSDLYVVGGYDGQRDLDNAAIYSLATGVWRELPPLATPRSGHALGYDGLAIFALGGGWHTPMDTHERYDPATGIWSNFPSPITGEWRHLAAVSEGERLHLLGGWSSDYMDVHLQYQSSFRTLLPVITND
jgi:DNA-binding CsgD family transcriptional regulator